ncbi:MAG: hypothetical protein IPJ77_08030 [Planctomycetes bacterium]|nr:hypothetical protein [Planctomycetota bacterium]
MTFNDWWQENKRFAVVTASGVLVFVIGTMLVDKFFTTELKANQAALTRARSKLATDKLYSSEQLKSLQADNEALVGVTDTLRKEVAFVPREGFRPDPKTGAAGSQYFQVVSGVRENLLTLAGRAGMRLPEELGLPALSPTREPEIVRYLEGLDLVDRAVHMALAAGVERIDKLEIKLDPKLNSKDGVGAIERTRVEIALSGRPGPLVQLLLLAQDAKAGGPLLVEKSEMAPARNKTDEATLEVTFVAARLHEAEPAGTP